MRNYRLIIVMLLLLFSFSIGAVIAQEESTEEPEMTEEVVEEPEATEAAPEATEEAGEEDDAGVTTYTVQPGDNLFRIALRYDLRTETLAEANNISNPSLIYVGQVLIIPGSGEVVVQPTPTVAPTEAPEATDEPVATEAPEATEEPAEDEDDEVATSVYVVQPGDTLFRIAVSNGTTVSVLQSLNPDIANPNLIFVGQRINLPADANASGDASNGSSLDVMMTTGVSFFLANGSGADSATLVSDLNVDWVKITVDWAVIEAEQGVFDFAALDAAIDSFEDADLAIMLTLTGAPDWSRPSATELALEQPTYGPPDDLDTFGTFAGEVADRYQGRIAAYEIWFQPNQRFNWMRTNVNPRSDGFPDAGLSDVRYIDLLEVAYNAIKAADADALVITGGLAPTVINDNYNSISNFVFFEELINQGAANFSDGFGVHIDGFNNAPDARCCGEAGVDPEYDEEPQFFFADSLDEYRSILNSNGAANEALWVTRFGWGTTENSSGDGGNLPYVQQNSQDDQAEYIAAALEIGDERGDIEVMILNNLNGCSTESASACYFSLIDASGTQRPAFDALSAFADDE